jgi:hypothetical protein
VDRDEGIIADYVIIFISKSFLLITRIRIRFYYIHYI